MQGIGNHRRGEDICNAHGLAHHGIRVQAGPLPRRHGDLGQLLRRSAEFMHMPPRSQGIGADRRWHAPGRFKLQIKPVRPAAQAAPTARTLIAAIEDQRDVAGARRQRHGRMANMHLERGATGISVIQITGLQVEIFSHSQRRHAARPRQAPTAGDQQAIHIFPFQTGIGQGVPRRPRLDLHDGGAPGHPPVFQRRVHYANDAGAVLRHQNELSAHELRQAFFLE